MTVAVHRVVWHTWAEDSFNVSFHCDGDQTADCRNYPNCGCETWDDDHEHPSVPQATCWVLPWLECCHVEDSYQGEWEGGQPPRRDAPIVTRFEETGPSVTWSYAEPTT